MKLSKEQCYKAIKSQDARFDGVFFTAVKSTGIYCRPVCKVPAPKFENCTFYDSQAEAETNGYRPCLRCRPELAPDYSEFVQGETLLSELMAYFEQNNFHTGLINDASEYFGVSTRHIHRLFMEYLGVSPKDYMMTKRLLNAKKLLTDTDIPVTEIALMVGFGSVSRFNGAVKKHYELTPTEIRKTNRKKDKQLIFKLGYRPPYDWNKMLRFFEMRAIPGVEQVENGVYRRALSIDKCVGWIEVKPLEKENKLKLTVSKGLEKVLLKVIKKVRVVFDLDASPEAVSTLKEGIRLPGSFDAFEMATRAILGQQITVKAARTLALRIVENLGKTVETPFDSITHLFPTAEKIASLENIEETLGELGVIRNRSRVIMTLANAMVSGELELYPGADPEKVRHFLLNIKGIGPWTAEYLLMRGLSYTDAFPVTDIGVRNALIPILKVEDEKLEVLRESLSKYKFDKAYEKAAIIYAEDFKPFRSYMTIALWDSLSED